MTDTVHFYLEKKPWDRTDFLSEIPCNLTNIGDGTKEQQYSINGKLKNLNVVVYENRMNLRGSWQKYFSDDPFYTMSLKDIKKVIEMLSDDLHISINSAKITRIDVANNFIMNFNPTSYYYYLGNSNYFIRSITGNSLYYNSGNRIKIFYDKKAECKKNKHLIPIEDLNINLLRYEYRLFHNISERLKGNNMVEDLCNERVFKLLFDEYKEEYENIIKVSKFNYNLDFIKKPSDLVKFFAAKQIQDIGYNEAIELIEEMRDRNTFDKPEYYSRAKHDIKELNRMPLLSESIDLIEELTSKIRNLSFDTLLN